VTLYRGKVVHIEGRSLDTDTDDHPASDKYRRRFYGFGLIAVGTFLFVVNVAIRALMRLR
jgi:hypothetical protein